MKNEEFFSAKAKFSVFNLHFSLFFRNFVAMNN